MSYFRILSVVAFFAFQVWLFEGSANDINSSTGNNSCGLIYSAAAPKYEAKKTECRDTHDNSQVQEIEAQIDAKVKEYKEKNKSASSRQIGDYRRQLESQETNATFRKHISACQDARDLKEDMRCWASRDNEAECQAAVKYLELQEKSLKSICDGVDSSVASCEQTANECATALGQISPEEIEAVVDGKSNGAKMASFAHQCPSIACASCDVLNNNLKVLEDQQDDLEKERRGAKRDLKEAQRELTQATKDKNDQIADLQEQLQQTLEQLAEIEARVKNREEEKQLSKINLENEIRNAERELRKQLTAIDARLKAAETAARRSLKECYRRVKREAREEVVQLAKKADDGGLNSALSKLKKIESNLQGRQRYECNELEYDLKLEEANNTAAAEKATLQADFDALVQQQANAMLNLEFQLKVEDESLQRQIDQLVNRFNTTQTQLNTLLNQPTDEERAATEKIAVSNSEYSAASSALNKIDDKHRKLQKSSSRICALDRSDIDGCKSLTKSGAENIANAAGEATTSFNNARTELEACFSTKGGSGDSSVSGDAEHGG